MVPKPGARLEIPAKIGNKSIHIEKLEREKAIEAYNTPGALWSYTFGGTPADAKRYAGRLFKYLTNPKNGFDSSRISLSGDGKTVSIRGSKVKRREGGGAFGEKREALAGRGQETHRQEPEAIRTETAASIPKRTGGRQPMARRKRPSPPGTVAVHVYRAVFTAADGRKKEYRFYLKNPIFEGGEVPIASRLFLSAMDEARRDSRVNLEMGNEDNFGVIILHDPDIKQGGDSMPLWKINPTTSLNVLKELEKAGDAKITYDGEKDVPSGVLYPGETVKAPQVTLSPKKQKRRRRACA